MRLLRFGELTNGMQRKKGEGEADEGRMRRRNNKEIIMMLIVMVVA
jgi:hypothetical protein